MEAGEDAGGEPQPADGAAEAGSGIQDDQALEEEMERLLDENEDLKVCCFHIKCVLPQKD